ncbi:MAG TPA: nuclear transport factor 2 family protein [Chloroflexota bacterium]|nr:nuclear transport factor 2 family protein [Chloroflexota bacterium]
MDTKAILDHQYEAFDAGNADDILKDFADDAVMIGPDGVRKGRAAIHAEYTSMFTGLFTSGSYEFILDAEHVEGEIAFIVWRATSPTAEVTLGTDTFVGRNGKIVVQTVATKINQK